MATLLKGDFRADCINWNGYRPRMVQQETGRADCAGCEEFEQGPEIYQIDYEAYEPNHLASANSIGIVELGGLGSIIRTTAVTRAIREINPSVELLWFTHSRGAKLLEYVPGVTPVDMDDKGHKGSEHLIDKLDILINFELAQKAKALVRRGKRIGVFALNNQGNFHSVGQDAEYLQRLQVDDVFRQNNHLTAQQVLLKSVGLGGYEPGYDIVLKNNNHQQADRILLGAFISGIPQDLVGLNIGTSEKGKVRRWPASYYKALALQLTLQYPETGIVILSGPDDLEVKNKIIYELGSEYSNNIAVLPSDIEIGDFMAVIKRLKLIVTSNTFAFHVAKAQNVPVITFDNPMPPQELEIDANDICFSPNLTCGPCYNRCTQKVTGMCMREVTVDQVARGVSILLKKA